MSQYSTRGRDCAVLVGLDVLGMTTSMDTHLYDTLGIGLGTRRQSAHLGPANATRPIPEICRIPWFDCIPLEPRDKGLLLQELV